MQICCPVVFFAYCFKFTRNYDGNSLWLLDYCVPSNPFLLSMNKKEGHLVLPRLVVLLVMFQTHKRNDLFG